MRVTLTASCLCLAVVTVASQLQAQTLRGVLVDRDSQQPIALGRVTMIGEARDSVAATLSDDDGYFTLSAPEAGTYRLVGSALGYRGTIEGPYALEDGAVQVVQLQLGSRPLPLPGVVVSAERLAEPEVASLVATGFYDRLLEGRGEFLTPGEIARSTVLHTPQLFREMVTVELVRAAGGRASAPWNDRVWLHPADPGAIDTSDPCPPRVYVDDVYYDLESMDPQPSLDDLVGKDDLEAIEVYRAPFGAPTRYQQTSTCGVILLWTKLRR